jgi:hypothetical protein
MDYLERLVLPPMPCQGEERNQKEVLVTPTHPTLPAAQVSRNIWILLRGFLVGIPQMVEMEAAKDRVKETDKVILIREETETTVENWEETPTLFRVRQPRDQNDPPEHPFKLNGSSTPNYQSTSFLPGTAQDQPSSLISRKWQD